MSQFGGRSFAALSVVLIAGCIVALAQQPPPSQGGQWEPEMSWPLQAIHMVALKSGTQIMVADHRGSVPEPMSDPIDVMLYNFVTNFKNTAPQIQQEFIHPDDDDNLDLFCGGHAALTDGRIVWAGGGLDLDGHNFCAIFNPDQVAGTPWTLADPLPTGRWYPTLTTLGNGKLLISGGRDFQPFCRPEDPENRPVIFDALAPGGAQHTVLNDAPWQDLLYYPNMWQHSTGKVYLAGGNEFFELGCSHTHSKSLNLVLGQWIDDVPLPSNGGSAFMYRPDKIMRGAHDEGGATADDVFTHHALSGASAWLQVASMNERRFDFYFLGLPDGDVMAVGGGRVFRPVGTPGSDPVLEPEIWNPDQPLAPWQLLNPMTSARMYHSSAAVLADGRVLVAGGEYPTRQKTAQIFKPPYLFDANDQPAPRPVINAATSLSFMHYGRPYVIKMQSADTAQITKVSLLRLNATTHSFDQNGRYLSLDFIIDAPANRLVAAAPANGNFAPPGHYMLFVLKPGDRPGIEYPSVAKIVRLEPEPPVIP